MSGPCLSSVSIMKIISLSFNVSDIEIEHIVLNEIESFSTFEASIIDNAVLPISVYQLPSVVMMLNITIRRQFIRNTILMMNIAQYSCASGVILLGVSTA